jgi:metal-responsive CopG/Arc/MetJ family transcriptional regulator
METQITLRLSADLVKRVDRAAQAMQRSRSDVVRRAIDEFVSPAPERAAFDRISDLIGSVESGMPDLGTNHRDYLLRKLRNARK